MYKFYKYMLQSEGNVFMKSHLTLYTLLCIWFYEVFYELLLIGHEVRKYLVKSSGFKNSNVNPYGVGLIVYRTNTAQVRSSPDCFLMKANFVVSNRDSMQSHWALKKLNLTHICPFDLSRTN
jgi:hypothetical protein